MRNLTTILTISREQSTLAFYANKKAFQKDAYCPLEYRMCFSFSGHHQMSLPWGIPNEQVWTGLQWSPPDVTCRGGSQNEQVWAGLHWWPPEVTNGGRGPQVWCPGVPYLTFSWEGWYPTMWPIPMMHLMLPSPSPNRQMPMKTLPSHNFVWGR